MNKVRFMQQLAAMPQAKTGERMKQMTVYSGASVYQFDWRSGTEYMLTLSMDPGAVNLKRFKNAPVLADHFRSVDRQVGVVEAAWIEGKKLMADTRFADTPDVEDIWTKIDTGILRNVSVEASLNQTKDVTKKGDAMRQLLAIDWAPEAVALVPVGADPGAVLMSDQELQELWLPEELYTSRRPHELAEAGAARPQMLTHMLLRRRGEQY